MPKFLLKQRQGWYAVLEIPTALRKHFGKVRFKQSLETDSLSIANSRVLPVIAEWKRQVAIAKGLEIGSNDELLATLALVRQDTQRHRSKGVPDYEIRMAQEEVALSEYLGDKNEGDGPTTLYDAISVAHGNEVLLREHVDEFFALRDVAPKTADMQRRDLMLFIKQFPYASDATRVKVRDWVNVTLGTEQGLSLATRRRMISPVSVYWDYLENSKGLTLPSPFYEDFPSEAKETHQGHHTSPA